MTRLSTATTPAPVTSPAVPAEHRGTALLGSKLAPPEPAHATVLRRRLLDLLTRQVQRSPLTLLSGPAGSGKTVLTSLWGGTGGAGRAGARPTLGESGEESA